MSHSFLHHRQKIKKLDSSNRHNEALMAHMKHDIDIFKSRNLQYKAIEDENKSLKLKCQNFASIECILHASQEDIDDVMKRQYSNQELYTMVGALKRELHQNELKRNELKKHINSIKNELRTEKAEKNRISEKLSEYEMSENCEGKNDSFEKKKHEEFVITPITNIKKRRLQLVDNSDPAPSTSPYFSLTKTSSSLISTALKMPLGVKQDAIRPKNKGLSNLSIFKNRSHLSMKK